MVRGTTPEQDRIWGTASANVCMPRWPRPMLHYSMGSNTLPLLLRRQHVDEAYSFGLTKHVARGRAAREAAMGAAFVFARQFSSRLGEKTV